MKKYRVKVNGKTYNVVLESVEEVAVPVTEEKKEPVKKIDWLENDSKDTTNVLAPIQGNVLNVLVKNGQKVKKGDVLLLIEAMKLENEVNSPVDGEVVEVLINKGQEVTNNQILVKIK